MSHYSTPVKVESTPLHKKLLQSDEIRRTWSLLFASGQVVELRALEASTGGDRYRQTHAGYFNNADDLIAAAGTIRSALGFYVTLQVAHPDLLHRAKNKLLPQKKGASTPDGHIQRYAWLPIDSDPARISQISSTDEQHQMALEHSRAIREALASDGWPRPIHADSGNGSHLLYKIDLAPSNKDVVKRVLEGIAARFNREGIHVDTTVYNPARIWKLYGSLACKGDDTDERPWRMARILDAPDQLAPVSLELLERIAGPAPQEATPRTWNGHTPGAAPAPLTIESFLQRHQIQTGGQPEPYQGGLRWILETCPFCGESDRAAILTQASSGALGFRCQHNRCTGKRWEDFRLYYEPNAYQASARKGAPAPAPEERATRDATSDQDERAAAPGDAGEKEKESAATRLARIAQTARFICTPGGELYARVRVNGHHEVISVSEKGGGFKRWLAYQYLKEYNHVPNSEAQTLAMMGAAAMAEYEGEKCKVYTRIAAHGGRVYLDLANDAWECVQIAPDGWKVIQCPPVYFRRPNGLLSLPTPVTGGSLADIRQFINVADEKDYQLVIAWLIGALHPQGPYPVLGLNGEAGSAKTMATKLLRRIIDPNEAPTRPTPKDLQALAIQAQNSMVVALDNLSSIPMWLSDALCRISTGAGYADREHYTNDKEKIFSATRPIIVNGIEDSLIAQSDLISRTMFVALQPPATYKAEDEITALFDKLHAGILGALLDAVSCALKNRATTVIERPPRMADLAKWLTAAEPALTWETHTFLRLFTDNQATASSIVTDSSPVAQAIMQFIEKQPSKKWSGFTSALHEELSAYEVYSLPKKAPKDGRALSAKLRRITPSMRKQGINIDQGRIAQGSIVTITPCFLPGHKADSDVANDVAKRPDVANDGPDVAKKDVCYMPVDAHEGLDLALLSSTSVANVAESATLSTFSSRKEEKKEGRKESKAGIADNDADFATSATQTLCRLHPDRAAIRWKCCAACLEVLKQNKSETWALARDRGFPAIALRGNSEISGEEQYKRAIGQAHDDGYLSLIRTAITVGKGRSA